MKRYYPILLLSLVMVMGLGSTVAARVKLVALPERSETLIRLNNPEATLIEEERTLTLQQGLNRIDFSWKGVSIDPDSIRLTPLSHPGQVVLLNVSYPPDEAALVWEINSQAALEEKVRISYLLSDIDRLIAYKLVANKEETKADFRSFMVLRNFSGEDFPKVRVMLDQEQGFDQSLAHEETKSLLFLTAKETPIQKVWTFDAAITPWDPGEIDDNVGIPVSYHITNSQENGLGAFALYQGKARVFQEDGHEGTIFLGEDRTKTVPKGEKMKIRIGDSRDIVVTQKKMSSQKTNVRRNNDNKIVLYNLDETIYAKIENFKDQPALLTMIQHLPGQWEIKDCNLKYERKDASTLEFKIELPAKGQKELTMHYNLLNIRP